MSTREWRWALTWAAVIVAVSCVPYFVAWLATPPGYQFNGILVNPYDGNSYLAKMRQGWAGAWQFHLTYTPEAHPGAYIFLFYLALGHVARLAGLPLILVYHLARALGGIALLLTIYAFLARLTPDMRERRLGFWLAGASAGLGWLGVAVGLFPIDLWVPEAFAFFSLLSNAHFPLAIALMLVILARVVWPAGGVWRWLAPGLAALALALIQPFALLPLSATLILWLPVRGWLDRDWPRSHALPAVAAVLFSAPILLYDYWAYTTNPALAAWSSQNVTPAPRVLDLVLGYGTVGLFAIAGAVVVARRRRQAELALVAWSAGAPVLAYFPFALQRRFLTGLGLPLAMLAALGVTRWLGPKLSAGRQRLVSAALVAISCTGTFFLLALLVMGALNRSGSSLSGRLYLSADEAAGMDWLLEKAPDQVVLAAAPTGMFLPGRAGVRVVAGHPFETIQAEAKQAQAESFFRGTPQPGQCQRICEEHSVRYVFVGPAEKALGGGSVCLQGHTLVFQQGDVAIYRVP
jgi:hypothetical protein